MVADGEERLFVSIVRNTPKSVGHQVEQVRTYQALRRSTEYPSERFLIRYPLPISYLDFLHVNFDLT
jgi:hypothetical protein